MNLNDRVKQLLQDWLQIDEKLNSNRIIIKNIDTFDTDFNLFELWYRGEPAELHQFYKNYRTPAGQTMFWSAVTTSGIDFRRVHSGLPATIIDKLVDITVDDLIGIKIYRGVDKDGKGIIDQQATELWELIANEHNFKEVILKELVKWMLVYECTVKINYDPSVSKYPIMEVIPGKFTDPIIKRGRYTGTIFFSQQKIGNNEFILAEEYTHDGVSYKVFNAQGRDVTDIHIEDIDENLYPFEFVGDENKMVLAVPCILNANDRYKGRGKSILSGKLGIFDSIDEIISTWMDSVRDSRTKTYIPDDIIPKDPETGVPLKPNTFDQRFIAVGANRLEGAKQTIDVETPVINSPQLNESFITFIGQALLGVISPSTLGFDVKKLDNAEAQREKEKTTLYSRDKVITKLQSLIPEIINKVLNTYALINEKPVFKYDVTVEFGEYANPSFEAQVETVGKAKASRVMSTYRVVEELYGDDWTIDEKKAEVLRIMKEEGIGVVEPTVNEFDDNPNNIDLENVVD